MVLPLGSPEIPWFITSFPFQWPFGRYTPFSINKFLTLHDHDDPLMKSLYSFPPCHLAMASISLWIFPSSAVTADKTSDCGTSSGDQSPSWNHGYPPINEPFATLEMAIEFVDLPIKNGEFPQLC